MPSLDARNDAPPIAFGPIPSRRLGHSLGINHVPPKACSYGCVYCQVGPTLSYEAKPRTFYPPYQVAEEVRAHVERLRARGEPIDYLTFAPDGEPTLDAGLALEIELLRPLGIPIAVITNGSLAWRPEVRAALRSADWVSVKVDAVDEEMWRKVDRPHPRLELPTILGGLESLAADPPARLVTETMLVAGYNDSTPSIEGVARFLGGLGVDTAYLSIPTRPTTIPTARPPDEATLAHAFHILSRHIPHVEMLVGSEGDAFASTGDVHSDLIRIGSVHPIRESAVRAMLERAAETWQVVDDMIAAGELTAVSYRGEIFYLRRFRRAVGVARRTD